MGDQQRIYPVQDPDIEAPQAPLVPRNASKSEKPESPIRAPRSNSRPPRPARSNSSSTTGGYQPFRREIPVHHSKPPKKRRSCCCRFFCWTISITLLLTVAIAISLGVLYLVFQPKLPNYTIDRMQITEFNLQNVSLHATFNVNITAENPNKKIGIYYEDQSHVTVWYTHTQLCEGVLPVFYQGHGNTTVFNLTLTGYTANATDILTSLQAQQQTGSIPLRMKAKVPIRIKLGKLKLFEVKFNVKCSLVVDTLAQSNNIKIKNSNCKFRLRI